VTLRALRRTLPLAALLAVASPLSAQEIADGPAVYMGGLPFSITVSGGDDGTLPVRIVDARGEVLATGSVRARDEAVFPDLRVTDRASAPLTVEVGAESLELALPFVPGWFSLIPPLIAIALALIFKEVITALFAGVWLGAMAITGFNPLTAIWRVIDTYAVPSLGDVEGGKTAIVCFSLLLGGMVGVIARNGGTLGIVEALRPLATSARRGKLATWLAGMAIFFDDYANTLLVGNTMRPITDRLKISREKLAYLVDSTAAPVAALIPVSTWVGYEISLIADGFRIAAEQQSANPELAAGLMAASPLGIFVETIPYLFYPLLALCFVFLTSVTDRDLGPMAKAEARAARGDGLYREGAMLASDTSGHSMDPKEGAPHAWYNAAIPVLVVVLVVLAGLYVTGRASAGPGANLMDIFGAADPFATLLWGSLAGCIVAVLMSVGQRILTVHESMDALVGGMRAMLIAMLILVLAWSLGKVTEDVGTAAFLAQILSGRVALELLPVLVFITSAAIAFATGTSWGTMSILLPVVIPLTVSLGGAEAFLTGEYHILLGVTSGVLAGAIFGDHCSPISDTTVMSSMASGCDHIDHVRTQLPYAMLVGGVSMVIGDIGTAYGLPNILALGLGAAVLFLVLRTRGTRLGEG
jgi:Na+/H+ antiporter NhaC